MKFTFGDNVQFDEIHKFKITSIHQDKEGAFWYSGGDYAWIAEERLVAQVDTDAPAQ